MPSTSSIVVDSTDGPVAVYVVAYTRGLITVESVRGSSVNCLPRMSPAETRELARLLNEAADAVDAMKQPT